MSEYKKIYFLGIGGIGMSAIARYYKFKGYPVAGYDRTPSDLTHELEKEGIDVHYEDDIDFIPKDVESTLVVYTPAIPETLGEFVYVKEHNYTLIKRSRMLGELSQGQTCLAVAGTHGKTTTSTMVAHILNTGHNGCSAFLGGISKNYGTNLLMSQTPTLVAEADEFDRSFLQLSPAIAVITAMDADHLDIYGTHEEYCKAFRQFAAKVTGKLVIKKGLPVGEADTGARIFSYSYDDTSADFHAENITKDELGHYTFDLVHPKGRICGIRTGVPGWVNVENSIAAGAVCLLHGVSPEGIRKGIGTFQGVRRRLDVHINEPGLTYIDDYAHHPKELASAISSIKNMFPEGSLRQYSSLTCSQGPETSPPTSPPLSASPTNSSFWTSTRQGKNRFRGLHPKSYSTKSPARRRSCSQRRNCLNMSGKKISTSLRLSEPATSTASSDRLWNCCLKG